MNKIFILLLIFSLFTLKAKGEIVNAAEINFLEPKRVDERSLILKAYFNKYNSPLEDSAPDFIEAADRYGIDWKLVPSIAGVESTFGKNIPGGYERSSTSYNCWGWGVYGTQTIYFKSWRDGIFTISKGLKENYIDLGLDTPYKMNPKYAASNTWGWKVDYFMKDLEKFSLDLTLPVNVGSELEASSTQKSKTFGGSALISFND